MLENLRLKAPRRPSGFRGRGPQWSRGLPRPAARSHILNTALVATVVGAGIAAYLVSGTKSSAQTQVTTGTVQRGSVLSTVSASGNIAPARTLSLNFTGTGKLTAVYVKKGQRVHAGQRLAKLDDTNEAAAVRTARAGLISAQANLQSLDQPLTESGRRQNEVAVAQAQAAIAQQKTALRDAKAGAARDRVSLANAVTQARAGLRQALGAAGSSSTSLKTSVGEAKGAWLEAQAAAARDNAALETALDQTQAQLQRDQAQLTSDQNDAATYASQVSSTTDIANGLQAQVDADSAKVADDKTKQHKDKCDLTPAPQPRCANDAYQLSVDQTKLADDQSALATAQSDQKTAQSSLDAANAAITSDQAKIVQDQNAVTNAQNALGAGRLKNAQSVNQAYRAYVNSKQSRVSGAHGNTQSVQSAQNALKNALANQKAGIVKDNQSVHTAEAALKSAKQSLQSTLAANAAKAEPATAGAVASARAQITSAEVGVENALDAERQTTLVAPVAGTVAAVNGAVGETPGTSASSSAASSTAFISLVDLEGPQVLASFSESDAAKIKTGQAATITVDALPNQALAAHVVSIDTTQTVVNNVVTYGVTLLLDRTAAGLKPGMTVSAAVIADKRDGVLHVPNAAVHTTGGSSFVTVVDAKGNQKEQAVQAGLVGDDATEIVSGLSAGQQIVVSTISALTSTTQGGGAGGGRFGGGAGGPVVRFGGGGG